MTDTQSTIYIPDIAQMPVGVPASLNGAQLFFGNGAPTATTGVDGGYYMDVAGSSIYGPRAGGAWPAAQSFKGQDGGALPLVAGAAIPLHRSLMFAADGTAILGDPTADVYLWAGIAAAAAPTGTPVQATRSGLLTDPAWDWTPRIALFAASGGLLTQAAPSTGGYHRIGAAVTATRILVAPEPVIPRA